MTSNNKINTLICIIPTVILVGIYQLPVMENTAIKYNISFDVNDNFPYSRNFQQNLEDNKISFLSYLDQPIVQERITNSAQIVNQKSSHLNSQVVNNNTLSPPVTQNTTIDIENTHINKINSCIEHCKVLMLGDSVMGDVSFALQRLLKKQKPDWEIIDAHKVSSGLSNQNYYNWPATAKKLIQQYKPDYTYVLMGTNDAQSFSSNGKGHAFGKQDWIEEYGNRVGKMITLLEENNGNWGWIELPLVKDASFNNRLQIIRNVQGEHTHAHFIKTENIFGKVDHSEPIDMKLRVNDGIHLNATGANKMAQILYENLDKP